MKKRFVWLSALLLICVLMNAGHAEGIERPLPGNPAWEIAEGLTLEDQAFPGPDEGGSTQTESELPLEALPGDDLPTGDEVAPDAPPDGMTGDADGVGDTGAISDTADNGGGLTLTLISDTSQNSGSSNSYWGHSFLIVRNNTGKKAYIGNYVLKSGEQATVGLRGADRRSSFDGFPCGGAYINYETLYLTGDGSFSNFSYITIDIDQEKLNIIAEYFRRNSYYHKLEHNCAWTASGAWNKVCPFLLSVIQDYWPRDLKFQIDLLPGSRKGTSLIKEGLLDPISDKKRIFYMDKRAIIWPLAIGETISTAGSSVETTATTATLNWRAAKGVENEHTATGRQYGKGYLVLYKKVNSDSYKEKYIDKLTTNTCTLSKLSPGTDYYVDIRPAYPLATDEGDFYPYGNGVSCSFTTNKITLAKTKLTLAAGKTHTLKTTLKGTTTTHPLFWGTTNPDVATVDGKGKVTAKNPGTATISVSYGGSTAKCSVTVTSVELSGYLWEKMSSVAKKIGGMKKELLVDRGTEWYSYSGKGVRLYTLHGYSSKTAQIVIDRESGYSLHGVCVGMTEAQALSATKKLKQKSRRQSGKDAEYWFGAKTKENYNAELYIVIKGGKVASLSYYMLGFD